MSAAEQDNTSFRVELINEFLEEPFEHPRVPLPVLIYWKLPASVVLSQRDHHSISSPVPSFQGSQAVRSHVRPEVDKEERAFRGLCSCESDAHDAIQRAVGRRNEYFVGPKEGILLKCSAQDFFAKSRLMDGQSESRTQSGGRYPVMPLFAGSYRRFLCYGDHPSPSVFFL